MTNARELFQEVLGKETLTRDDVDRFLKTCPEFFRYYSKTKFFYTDRVYMQSEEGTETRKNFEDFGDFKLEGRQFLNDMMFAGDGYENQLLDRISQEHGISRDELNWYTMHEMPGVIDGEYISTEEIEQRKQAYLLKGVSADLEYRYGKDAEEIIRTFEQIDESERNTLSGQTANPGKYTGSAKVLPIDINEFDRLHEKVEEMEKGQVLVAETTGPDIIAACNKAGAIITNQGGMMSHAAIVSRELDIPCIVGVGDATHHISESEEIEVDADNGVVRKIK
jgi:phosphohistidine swiveling domain-containing protein